MEKLCSNFDLASNLRDFRADFCNVMLHATNLVENEEKKLLTRISFSKKSVQIPKSQPAHNFILATVGNSFLRQILLESAQICAQEKFAHLILPDFAKEEIDTFLKFIYGQLEEIDPNLPICQLFLEEKFLKKEELIPEDNLKNDEFDDSANFETYDDLKESSDEENEPLSKRKKIAPSPEISPKSAVSKKKKYLTIKEEKKQILAGSGENLTKEAKIWTCKICSEDFANQTFSNYVEHFESKHKEIAAKAACEKCGKNLECKEELLVHFLNEICPRNLNADIECALCPCKFFNSRNLQAHVFLRHSSKCKANLSPTWCLYFCEVCLKMFQTLAKFTEHQKLMHQLEAKNFNETIGQKIRERIEEEKRDPDFGKPVPEELQTVIFCRTCCDIFQTRSEYREHFTKAHADILEKCSQKEKYDALYDNIGFTNGAREAIAKKVYVICRVCDKSFTARSGFRRHMMDIHQDDKVYPCKKCKKPFPTLCVEVRHRKTCQRNIPCPKCDMKFFSEASLKKHLSVNHGNGRNEKRKIHESFKLPDGTLRYKCDVCDKVLNSNKAVYHHKAVIHGDMISNELLHCPHPGCSYSHRMPMYLKTHMNAAHGEKRHICDQCGQKFRTPCSLKVHFMRNHGHEELACETCGKIYNNPETLRRHKEIHRGASFVCNECGKAFPLSQGLRQHMKYTHSDVKRFICNCGRAFKFRSHLIRHGREKGHNNGKVMDDNLETFTDISFSLD